MLEECKVEEGDGEVGVWSAEGCLATLHDLNMTRFYRASMQQESSRWGGAIACIPPQRLLSKSKLMEQGASQTFFNSGTIHFIHCPTLQSILQRSFPRGTPYFCGVRGLPSARTLVMPLLTTQMATTFSGLSSRTKQPGTRLYIRLGTRILIYISIKSLHG